MKRNYCLFLTLISWMILIGAVKAEPAAQKQYVDGAVMAEQIRGKLQSEGFSSVTKIAVDADDSGAVTLKGEAASDAEAARAVQVAKETQGVMAVKSEIVVKRLQ